MNDALDIIVKRMNDFGKTLSEKSNTYFKKAVDKSSEYTEKGVQHIEVEKLKWKLKKTYVELGKYIYISNLDKNTVDYSDDEKFILLTDKINRIRTLINQKLKT